MNKTTNWTTLGKAVAKAIVDPYRAARAEHDFREDLVELTLFGLRDNEFVKYGETKHRVRKYNQETVSAEETIYAKANPGPRDGSKQRTVTPLGTRNVKRMIGRTPGPATYETWVTASWEQFTGSGPTKEAALRELANLCTR